MFSKSGKQKALESNKEFFDDRKTKRPSAAKKVIEMLFILSNRRNAYVVVIR